MKESFETFEALDVRELRAQDEVMPLRFECDKDNKKADWYI